MNSLDSIIYISVPEDFHHHIGDFHIDSSILLPIETTGNVDEWEPDSLSWEMIVAGMLKVLAYDPDHEDAEYYRKFVFAARPDIVNEFSETGIINAHNGELEVAEEIFSALAGLLPGATHPRVNLALVYDRRSDAFEAVGNTEQAEFFRERAMEAYATLLRQDETIPDVHLNAGLFYLKIRDYSRAREQLEFYTREGDDDNKIERAASIVKEIDTQNLADELFHEAFTLIRDGNEKTGLVKAKEFLTHHENAWNGWFLVGWGNRRIGRYAEAYDAFQKVLEMGGESTDALNELAICAMELGAFDESRRHLEAALRLDPDDTRVISNLGVLSMKLGNSEEAERFFATVLEIAPEDPVATEYIRILNS